MIDPLNLFFWNLYIFEVSFDFKIVCELFFVFSLNFNFDWLAKRIKIIISCVLAFNNWYIFHDSDWIWNSFKTDWILFQKISYPHTHLVFYITVSIPVTIIESLRKISHNYIEFICFEIFNIRLEMRFILTLWFFHMWVFWFLLFYLANFIVFWLRFHFTSDNLTRLNFDETLFGIRLRDLIRFYDGRVYIDFIWNFQSTFLNPYSFDTTASSQLDKYRWELCCKVRALLFFSYDFH